ncbi:MAG TPA: glucokinase [Candidatus Binataceae bacterium]|nr:glucokinase [Candidatus Binataceae bacterium]
MILACDVGGTKTTLALLELGDTQWRVMRRETYRSREHTSLDEIVKSFVGPRPPRLAAAGFGIAGPVRAGQAKTTNLPWTVDGPRLAQTLALGRVSLLNDVEAQAWSVLRLGAAEQMTLQAGTPDSGNMAVIAAGTGLGCSALVRGEGAVRSLASEGGHADFSPRDEIEVGLLRYLRAKYGHVSVERVLSGPGLFEIFEFLRDLDRASEPDWLVKSRARGDPTAAVAEAALGGRCALAERAVLLFLGAYGAETGNWALRTMATGGVWLGGGVAHKLLVGPPGTPESWRLRAVEVFLTRLRDKGRLSALLESMPVHVIMTNDAPLFGAADFANSESGRRGRTEHVRNRRSKACKSG